MKIQLSFLALAIACALSGACFADDSQVKTVTGEQLERSITSYDNEELGPVKTVLKAWNETHDARSQFDISFYGSYPEFRDARSIFLQTIKVFDGKKEIQVHEGDFAECSFEKMLLTKRGESLYLVLANRSSKDRSNETLSVSTPAPQLLRLFELVQVGKPVSGSEFSKSKNAKPDSEFGKSRVFFKKIAERKTTEAFCAADAIYPAMQEFANEALR
jgi:hypothetical protein